MFNQESTRTELSSIGEFALIEKLTSGFNNQDPSSIVGVGDDAAVLEKDETSYGLLSTDLLAEGVHFDLSYVPLKHLGYKAVVVNLSDIYAMNGTPRQIVISLAVSNRFSVEALQELYEGIHAACAHYGVDLVGGDVTSSRSGLIISVAAYGTCTKEKVVYRKGASEHDLIVMSGDCGGAYLGLQVLEREKVVFSENPSVQPDLSGHDYILGRQLKPEARKDVISRLAECGAVPTSMIDISDGLASELLHLSKASGLGMDIYEDKIPLDPASILAAEEFNLNPLTCALNGGEDYELLFTIRQSDLELIHSIPGLSIIGHVTAANEPVRMITSGNTAIALQAQGWDHFHNPVKK